MASGLNLNNKITWAGNDKPKFQEVFSGKTTSEIKNMTKEERLSQLRDNSNYNTGHTTNNRKSVPYTEINKVSKKPDTIALASLLEGKRKSVPAKPEKISQAPNNEKKPLVRKKTSYEGVTPNTTYSTQTAMNKLSLFENKDGKFISGTVDQSFPNGDNYGFDSDVYAIVVQPDGKILIGGDFSYYYFDGNSYYAPYLIRLNSDGTVDETLSTNNLNGSVYAITLQPDGKILLGGNFNYYDYNGDYFYRIIRINSDGSPDYTFSIGNGFNDDVYDIQLQSDGKILVGGSFYQYNNINAYRIIRLNINGSIDYSFAIGDEYINFNNYVNTIKIQSDGKILVGGIFSTYANISRNNITRLNSDGTIDTSFYVGDGFNGEVNSIDLQSDGKIIVGGNFGDNGYYDNNPCNYIVRLNTDGSLDSTFGFGLNNTVYKVLVQSDDKILVGGTFGRFWPFYGSYYNYSADELVRYNADTTIDWGFYHDELFCNYVNTIALQSDNKILVGGSFTTNYNSTCQLNYFGRLYNHIPKYKYVYSLYSDCPANYEVLSVGSNTLLDINIENIYASARSLNNSTEVKVGYLTLSDGIYPYAEPDYVLENLYNNCGEAYSDNYLYVKAYSLLNNDYDWFYVSKQYKVGDIFFTDQTFRQPFNFRVRGCLQITQIGSPNSSVYTPITYVPYETCEECVRANGVIYDYVNADIEHYGSFLSYQYLDPTKYPAVILPNTPTNSNFIIGSETFFSQNDYQGIPEYKSLVSFNNSDLPIPPGTIPLLENVKGDGQLDYTFNSEGLNSGNAGANDFIFATKLQDDGKILVGGQFNYYNNEPIPGGEGFIRLNTDGTLDKSFIPNIGDFNNYVYSIEPLSNGILIGGALNYGGLQNSNEWINQLDGDGTISRTDKSWVLTGPNDGGNSGWSYVKRQFTESGQITLNYKWYCNDDGTTYDWPFYYVSSNEPIGNTNIDFEDNIFTSGSFSTGVIYISYNAGDWVSIGVYSDDSTAGAGVLEISEYVGMIKTFKDGTPYTEFNNNVSGKFDDTVYAIAETRYNQILVGGSFAGFGDFEVDGFVRLNSDGTLDENFLNTKVYFNNEVYDIKTLSDGKILVSGRFNSLYDPKTDTGYDIGRLVRLNEDGSLDLSFNSDGTPSTWSTLTPFSGVTAQYIRWTINGIKNDTYSITQVSEIYLSLNGSPVSFNGDASVTNPDGDNPPGEGPQNLIDDDNITKWTDIAFSANGESVIIIDNTVPINFDSFQYVTANDEPGRDPISWTLDISNDGLTWSTVMTVDNATITNNRRTRTQKFATDTEYYGGSIYFDGTSFVNADTNNSSVWDIEGNDLTIEWFQKFNGDTLNRPAVFSYSDTYLSFAFNNTNGVVIYINGDYYSYDLDSTIQNTWCHFAITRNSGTWRIFQNGVQLGSFNDGITFGIVDTLHIGSPSDYLKDPNNAGFGLFKGYITNFRVNNGWSYYNSNFTPPTAPLGPNDNQDGNVVLCLSVNNKPDFILDNCDDETPTYNSGNPYVAFNERVFSIEVDSDNKILLGGRFDYFNDNYIGYGLARLNSNGSIDSSFIIGEGFNNEVRVVKSLPDGKILVGGYFTYYFPYGGWNTWDIARLNSDGSPDEKFITFQFGEGFSWGVRDIAVQEDGNSIIGGWFNYYFMSGIDRVGGICRLYTANKYKLHDFTTCDGDNGIVYVPTDATLPNSSLNNEITPITYELIPTQGLDLVYDGIRDDATWEVSLPTPFDVNFLGVNYSSVNVSTNPYITFGNVTNPDACCFDIPNDIPSSVGLPGVFISFQCDLPHSPGDYDSNMLQLYTGLTDGGNTLIIKYFGEDHCNNIKPLNYTYKFYKDISDYFDLFIDDNTLFFNGDPTGGISDGVNPTWLATFNSTGGNAYRIGVYSAPIKANLNTDPVICGTLGDEISGYTFTQGSLYFSGDDNVKVNFSNDFQVLNGDFTIEWFQNRENNGQNQRVFDIGSWDNPIETIAVSFENSTYLTLWINGDSYNFGDLSDIETWCHLAISKQNNIIRVFKNGVQIGDEIITMKELYNTNGDGLSIGNMWSSQNSAQYQGYITNFRWVKGVSLYNSNFEVPSSPLTAVDGTKLLLLVTDSTNTLTDSSGTGKNPYNDGVGPVDFNTFTPFSQSFKGFYSEVKTIYDSCDNCNSDVYENVILYVTDNVNPDKTQRFYMKSEDINKVLSLGPVFTTTMSNIPTPPAYQILTRFK